MPPTYAIPRANVLSLTIDGEQLEVDLKTWAIARVDSLSDRAYAAMASITADDVIDVLTRGRADAVSCGRGWEGTKGGCVRSGSSATTKGRASLKNIAKGGAVDATRRQRQERIAFLRAKLAGKQSAMAAAPAEAKKPSKLARLGKEAKHQGIHLAENIAAWKVGKVVGGAISAVAVSHGANPEAAKLLAETGIQALTATALSLRDPSKRKPRDVAAKFVAEAGAAFIGKTAHGGMESAAAALGASAKVEAIAALISGKAGGIGTNVALTRSGTADRAGKWLTDRGRKLQQFYRLAGSRRDSAIRLDNLSPGDAEQLAELLYELSAYAMLQVLTRGRADAECGRGWEGTKGGCVRAKSGTREALASDAANVGKWSMGKVVGGAIAVAAQHHGVTDPPALLLAESATQALLSTVQKVRQKKMGAGAIAAEFISETVALMATKFEPAWDDGVRGGSDEVRMMLERIASPDAPAQAKALYRQSRDRLAALVKGRKLRLDSSDITEQDSEALLMLSVVALGIIRRRNQATAAP